MPDRAAALRFAFLLGAVTDALALVPLLVPAMAQFLWGFDPTHQFSRFVAGYAAALMLGWTALLVWASRRPLERRAVAALTMLVILGLVFAEAASVSSGEVSVRSMLLTWGLQLVLLAFFARAYWYERFYRGAGA